MIKFKKYFPVMIFFIFFLGGISLISVFNGIYAKRILKYDADQLLYHFHDALVETQQLLASLPDPKNFQCNDTSVKQLAKLAYDYPSVRLVGFHGKKVSCTSEPILIELSQYQIRPLAPKKHDLSNIYSLASEKNADQNIDLMMVRSHGEGKYFASLNPFLVDYLTDFACKKCLEYDFILEGSPQLEFRSALMGEPSIIEYKSSKEINGTTVTLYLRASQKLYNYYSELSWFTVIIFSAIVSLIFSLLAKQYIISHYSFENTFKDGLINREFIPYFQPVVDSRNGEVVGAEILARWHRQDGSTIPPYQFIPFAETSGLIVEITEQLIAQTATAIKSLGWNNSEKFMSLNIVPEHLTNKRLYQAISELSRQANISAKSFSLEITERMEISNLENARETLDDFYRQGIELKLDDAGTGYGGFSYIQELGVSTIKIDKMFIDTIGREDVKAKVLDAIISFAKTSGLEIIAEGVEHEYQVQYLKQNGVFLIQGYVYAKPMPFKELVLWLDELDYQNKTNLSDKIVNFI